MCLARGTLSCMFRPFEILEHPADVGFRAWGRTREELLENAALALFSLMYELETVQERESRAVQVSGPDFEALLYAWLAELLAMSEAERYVFRRAAVTFLGADCICATVYGEPLDRNRHHSGTQVKAVTYHQLQMARLDDGWTAQVFVDL